MIRKGVIVLFFLTLLLSCSQNENGKLRLAAAANMQFVMQELVSEFTLLSGIECEVILGSSGKLTAQIIEGAPFDVFLSANMKYPNELYQRDLTMEKTVIYAYGKLVLWTLSLDKKPSLELLNSDEINHIAMANPKIAPYGLSAIEVLEKSNLFELINDKIVYGENIAQTNQFILSQVAEVGFTSKSVVLSPKMLGKGLWIEIDSDKFTPIAQGMVILNNRSDHLLEAKEFNKFLLSSKAKEILNKFGYETNEF